MRLSGGLQTPTPPPPRDSLCSANTLLANFAPDIRRKLQKLQYGPQTLTAQLLDRGLGVLNDKNQAEEDKTTQCETRWAKRQTQMMAVPSVLPCSLRPTWETRDTQGESLEQPPQKRAPQALSSMQNVRPLEEGMSLAPKGRGHSQISDGPV